MPSDARRSLHDAGIGVGLRHAFADALIAERPDVVRFVEIHPENYVRRGGRTQAELERARAHFPVLTHGLTLGVGNVEPFDRAYLRALRDFLQTVATPWHSEHLCFTAGRGAHFHDLMPMPLTHEAVAVAVARIRELRDALELPIAVENVTYYTLPGRAEMTEGQFLVEVLERADCKLLLDVNNVYVNARNHGTDPHEVLDRIPRERVVQMHVAGHLVRPDGLRIDTHAEPVPDDVFALLAIAAARFPGAPILLERDGNYPPLAELVREAQALDATVREARDRARATYAATPPAGPARTPELAGVETALAAICFDGTPRDDDFQRVGGDASRLRLYRSMVRTRIVELAEEALPRTREVLGAAAFRGTVESWLTAAPPVSRFFRDLVGELVAWAWPPEPSAARTTATPDVPHWLSDLARLEGIRWEVTHAATERPTSVVELSFDLVPIVDPGARFLRVAHAVNEPFDLATGPAARTVHLCVHRRPSDHVVDVWTLNDVTARLLAGWRRGTETLAETTKRVLAEDAGAPTPEFLDGLGTVLADLLERGVILGSRGHSPGF